MDRHFGCTACGKCCFGWLPLTIDEALCHSGRFPLGVAWTPVRRGSPAFDITARTGITVKLPNRKQAAVRITPLAYLPPSFPCPALTPEGLCGIQEEKPLRCRSMPFSPDREERDQGELLKPRKDWACDTSSTAPLVYRDRVIVTRDDFDREGRELSRHAPVLRAYAELLLAAVPALMRNLLKVAANPSGGHLVLNFATLEPKLRHFDAAAFAARQIPVLGSFAARTDGFPALREYHRRYREWMVALGAE